MKTLQKPETLQGKFVNLRLATQQDAEFMLALRNNPKKAKCFCHAVLNDIERQKTFIRKSTESESEYLLIIENKNHEPIGMTSIYNIEGTSYTGGRWAMQDGSSAEEMLEAPLLGDGYAFNVLGMEIKKCDVLKTNKQVIRWHKITGHEVVGEDENEIYFILKKDIFNSQKEKFFNWVRGE